MIPKGLTPEGIEFTENEWAPALRSGKYAQGRRALHKNGEFCCLGVACELLKDRLGLATRITRDGIAYDGETGTLPSKVSAYLGISVSGKLADGRMLAELNDIGTSFNEIADILEKEIQQ